MGTMIYATPSTSFTSIGEGFAPGLAGTIGVRIEYADGTSAVARTTAGVVELEAGSGAYAATLVAPAAGNYVVLWDSGGGSPVFASEELLVSATGVPPALESTAGYASVGDVRAALAPRDRWSDRSTAASLSDADLEAAIARASEKIDSRLGGRYAVPLDPVPATVTGLAVDLAAFDAALVHRESQPLVADHPVRLRYGAAVELLGQLAEGSASLEGVAELSSGSVVVENRYEGDLFLPEDFGLGTPTPLWERWLG